MDRQDFLRLISPEGQSLLNQVGELDTKADVVQLVSRLRAAGHAPELVATVLSQVSLRRRAKTKFGDFANQLLFTEDGLEQASRLQVSALHAGRFRQASIKEVADLGCGIGSESLAMAALDLKVAAFELDEVTAAIATYNLASFENVRVEQADVTELDLSKFESLFFDPARRDLGSGRRERAVRKFDPADFSPNFDFVLTAAKDKPTGVKLGPGHPHDEIPEECEAQWVSVNGDLVELSLWFGKLARPGVKRSALLIDKNGKHELHSDTHQSHSADLGELESFIYEPDNAIVRSHLIAELAKQTGTHLISAEIAYLSSNTELTSPWLKGYRVIANLTFDRKKLKAELRDRGIGILEIKKRGADIVPEALRKELQLKGKSAATLIVTRVGDAHRALICESLT